MRLLLLTILPALLFVGCGKKIADSPDPGGVPGNPVLTASLTFPEQNAVCTTGTIVSDTQSSVTFTWKAGVNAAGYDLVLKNLLTNNTSTQNTTDVKITVTLNRNTPYSWYVVSKSAATTATAQSDTWKFYNSGPGITTYAPFPAELTSPTYAQAVNASTINLTWKGSTPTAGTIANYDIYFGTAAAPPLYKANVTDSFLNNISIVTKTTYYWKVVTRNADGNTAHSAVSQFTVN